MRYWQLVWLFLWSSVPVIARAQPQPNPAHGLTTRLNGDIPSPQASSGVRRVSGQAVAAEPTNPKAVEQLQAGNVAYRNRNFAQATIAFRQAARLQPQWAQAQTALGHALLAQRQYRSAKLAYDAALRLDSLDRYARLGLGVITYRQKQYTEAARHFTLGEPALLASNPAHSDAFLFAGLSYLEAKQVRRAETALKTANTLNPNNPATQLALSDLFRRQDRFYAALHHVEQALPNDRSNAQLLTNRGSLYLKLNQMDQAYDNFRQALKQNPRDMNALNGAGVALLELDRIDAAAAIYDSLINRGHRTAFLYNNRGIVRMYQALRQEQRGDDHQAKQHYSRAQADFQKAQATDTTSKYYQNNLGNLFKNTRQYDYAVKAYQAYLSKTAINNMAVMYASAKRPAESRLYFDVALKLDSGNRAFMYNKYVLYSRFYKDSLAMKPDLVQAGQGVSAKTISTKYSLDGYINIYLYDYGFDTYEYPEAVVLPIPPDPPTPVVSETTGAAQPLAPAPTAVAPAARKSPAQVERRRMPRMKKAKHRGSTRCPVF
ncbi:hypothetical protein DYU11_11950 [Fibrisoma montanum]|uniref:Uncharacterized protein n=1 Tax=Fibrisoma montanum TaxID=2305895 RepID=A0A418MBE7_9BACT|nr:tetratricopeptide repeat protein [Fibrisoma montanum]RIV23684.1 hypothetical protein DYU11_11950 [Fibrisoma montanum]